MTPSEFYRRMAILILVVPSIASCTSDPGSGGQPLGTATDVPTMVVHTVLPVASTVSASTTPARGLASFAFPTAIEPTSQYIFYLHGKIVEDQGIPAISPEYGEYRYEEILKALQSFGFVVISEQRPRDADSTEYALRVAGQVNDLLNSEVSPGSITVVGASKGAAIATIVSHLVGNSEVNYVLLGTCYPALVDEWKQQGVSLSGNVLAIYDSSDEYAGSCEGFFAFSEGNRLGQHSELVLYVGTGHGILYEPLSEWVVPTVRWASQEW
jgi:hypothetical protein